MGYGYGSHWGMMGWGNGGLWPLGMIVWVIVIVAIIVIIGWVVRRFSSPLRFENRRRPPGLDLLDERYARGEISREEYLQKQSDILGH
jgi:putative membrane protein